LVEALSGELNVTHFAICSIVGATPRFAEFYISACCRLQVLGFFANLVYCQRFFFAELSKVFVKTLQTFSSNFAKVSLNCLKHKQKFRHNSPTIS
jgi:hypothetical protein